jgi:hypothetical protein
MLDDDIAIQISQQYACGKRKFSNINLEQANLEQVFLSQVDFSHSILKDVNLEQADLSNALLIGASLIGANLSRANLRSADFTKADLHRANLTGATIIAAKFADTNLRGANLTGAFFMGVDLSTAHLEGAIYDDKTNLASDFDPWVEGMIHISKMESLPLDKLLAQFNRLISNGNRLLGPTITAKYFNSSRPDFDWLNQFQINSDHHISYRGNISDPVNPEQADYFRQWIDAFTQTCSKIIKNFAD